MLDRGDLMAYQHKIIDHIQEHPFSAIWVSMGLGKTTSTLTATLDMLNTFDVHKTLVIAPLRVARKVWTDEIKTWRHLQGLTTSIVVGSARQRKAALRQDADIHIVNRENVDWLVGQYIQKGSSGKWVLVEKWPWDHVIIDESRSFQSHGSNRFKALRRVRKYISRMVQLTGTPATNGLMGLWAQLYLLDLGERLGPTITSYRDKYFVANPYNPHVFKPLPDAEDRIFAAVNDICMSLNSDDFFGVPDVRKNVIAVDLGADVLARYQEFQRTFVLELKQQVLTAVNAGVLWSKLLQLASGALYLDDKHNWEEVHTAKIGALLEVLADLTEPAIVVYNFISDRERIVAALSKAKANFRVLKDVKDEDDWNAGKVDVLLLHPMSAGHGLNLHKSGSGTLIHFGLNPDLDLYLQVNARLFGGHRGRGKPGVIHHLVAEGTVDETVLALLDDKADVQQRLFDATRRLVADA